MLVVSRTNQESVVVSGADGLHRLFRVKVLEIRGGNVKLGFEVDTDVPVHRAEVWERINANNQPSAWRRDRFDLKFGLL